MAARSMRSVRAWACGAGAWCAGAAAMGTLKLPCRTGPIRGAASGTADTLAGQELGDLGEEIRIPQPRPMSCAGQNADLGRSAERVRVGLREARRDVRIAFAPADEHRRL